MTDEPSLTSNGQPGQQTLHIPNWWQTVHIGSIIFPQWAAVNETTSFDQVQSILNSNPFKFLVVVNSLNLEDVQGMIYRKTVKDLLKATPEEVKDFDHQLPVNQIPGLISKDFQLLQISGVIGELIEILKKGSSSVILYRTTEGLLTTGASLVNNSKVGEDDDGRDCKTVEKKQLVAVVNERDVKNWIRKVEGHHNIDNDD